MTDKTPALTDEQIESTFTEAVPILWPRPGKWAYLSADNIVTLCRAVIAADRALRAEVQEQADAPKPLDDPHLQQAFGDAIEGALAFGFQQNNRPPEGHWLWRFWNIGNAEAIKQAVAQGNAFELVGFVNGNELDNMLDDRATTIQGKPDGYRRTPLYRRKQNQ